MQFDECYAASSFGGQSVVARATGVLGRIRESVPLNPVIDFSLSDLGFVSVDVFGDGNHEQSEPQGDIQASMSLFRSRYQVRRSIGLNQDNGVRARPRYAIRTMLIMFWC